MVDDGGMITDPPSFMAEVEGPTTVRGSHHGQPVVVAISARLSFLALLL